MNFLVFDIETKNTLQKRSNKSSDILELEISVVGAYSYLRQEYAAFEENKFGKLWDLINESDALVGFNSNHFDIPILNKYYPGDLTELKSIDLLEAVKDSIGRRLRMDWIAKGTLNIEKSADGLKAIEWWRNGEKEKVKEYCLKDVEITKKLFEYANETGTLKYKDLGTVHEFPIDTTGWKDSVGVQRNGLLKFE